MNSKHVLRNKLEEAIDLLLEAGYAKATLVHLSPLDKIIGGLAWCISSIQMHEKFSFVYNEEATLGEKLKFGENIESALEEMKCPFPLRAHQIRGLDDVAIHKTLTWVIDQLSDTRHANQSNELEETTIPSSENSNKNIKNTKNIKDMKNRKSQKHKNLCELKERIKDKKMKLQNMKIKNENIILENQNLLNQVEIKKKETKKWNKKIEKIKENLNYFDNKNEFHSNSFFDVVRNFQTIEELEREEKELISENDKIKIQFQKKEFPSHSNFKSEENFENEENLNEENLNEENENELLKKLKKEVEEKNKSILNLKFKFLNRPSHSELLQYERRIIELFELIQKKHISTKSLFSSYNFVCDIEKYTKKEISLLNSIHDKMKHSFSSSQSKKDFVNSIQALFANINNSIKIAQKRVNEVKDSLQVAQNEENKINQQKYIYSALLQQITDEIERGESLQKERKQDEMQKF